MMVSSNLIRRGGKYFFIFALSFIFLVSGVIALTCTPAETFTVTSSSSPDYYAVLNLLNDKYGLQEMVPTSDAPCGFAVDSSTADAVCREIGYDYSVSTSRHRTYSSPHNNCIADFDSVSGWDAHIPTGSEEKFHEFTCRRDLVCLPACSDGIDNDGDGFTDMSDFGCSSPSDDTEGECSVSLDCGVSSVGSAFCGVDGNVYKTSTSYSCSATQSCSSSSVDVLVGSCDSGCSSGECIVVDPSYECSDGIDNDGDGATDFMDPGCWSDTGDPSSYDPRLNNEARAALPNLPECSDGIDNDGDGFTDMSDFGCSSPSDDTEGECSVSLDCGVSSVGSAFCGVDGNVYKASTSYSCSATQSCSSSTVDVLVDSCEFGCSVGECIVFDEPECSDGIDNDGDGDVDSYDSGCWDNESDSSTYNPSLNDEGRSNVTIVCYSDSQCGSGFFLSDSLACSVGDVYGTYRSFSCENAGTYAAYCSSSDEVILESDCGDPELLNVSSSFCVADSVYISTAMSVPSCSVDSCDSSTVFDSVLVTDCALGCSNGLCNGISADSVGPTVSLLAPEDGASVFGDITFNATISDASLIVNASLVINGEIVDTILLPTDNISFVYTPSESLQNYTWMIIAYDVLGNRGESVERSFLYSEPMCSVDLDCGRISYEYVCIGDDIVREVTIPVCSYGNSCSSEVASEFVRTCRYGCFAGICEDNGGSSGGSGGSPRVLTVNSSSSFTGARSGSFELIGGSHNDLDSTLQLGTANISDSSVSFAWSGLLLFLIVAIIFIFILIVIVRLL